ncbi:MAG: putative transport system permease protein, partial [Acidimicrobiaceae bacterium]|nr:putative transport system permease protein [Acidimicrobiaceae bacterium]
MSATLVAHRAAAARPNGGAPARRALTRWAWRMFRREWRQQLLVLSLIIIAVTATIVGAAVATNSPPPKNAGFGTADHLVLLPPTDAQLSTDIASIAAQFGGVDVVENQNVATGLAQGAVLRAQDPNGRYGSPMLALRSGRFPSNADEVSMSTELAAAVGMHVGDVWSTDARAWRVVGLVENPENLLERFGLV